MSAEGRSISSFDWSVVIPCHNPGPYLTEAVESALASGCDPRNLVLIDDGGADGWVEKLHHQLPSLRVARNPVPRGTAAARNAGLALVNTRWVSFLDQDDYFIADNVRDLLRRATSSSAPRLPLVGGAMNVSRGRTVRKRAWPRTSFTWRTASMDLLYENVQIGRWIFPLDLVVKYGFDENVGFADDLAIAAQVASKTHVIAVPQALLAYRVHPNQVSQSPRMERSDEQIERLSGLMKEACLGQASARHVNRRLRSASHFRRGYAALRSGNGWAAVTAFVQSCCSDPSVFRSRVARRVLFFSIGGAARSLVTVYRRDGEAGERWNRLTYLR